MNNKYSPKDFEEKWIEKWIKDKVYKTPEISNWGNNSDDKKFYSLYSFPYPSGDGLHVGHAEGMVANDIMARYWRMKGRKVLFPMGWDSFGLPAENYAIKTGTPPEQTTEKAVKTFYQQINRLGISVDWETEVGAHRPNYYKWTQWIFLQLFKKGLAYKKNAPVNWCPVDQTVLANEQVIDGKCERCGNDVIQREMNQWFFKITDYADRLDKDLDKVDWPNGTKQQQRNWIGKSVGAEIVWKIVDNKNNEKSMIKIFTTRLDTIFGATFLVISPEHKLIQEFRDEITNINEVSDYVSKSKNKSDLERQSQKIKSGIKAEGLKAINPFNNEELPIYIADYVLNSYGTGAIMAVPAHDERDYEFANKYKIDIKEVIAKEYGVHKENSVFVNGVSCLIYNKTQKKYLVLSWPDNPGKVTLVGGGIENGENELDAIKREIKEEVGIGSYESIIEVVPRFYSNYWHSAKNIQRHAQGKFFLIIIEDKNIDTKVALESHEKFTPLFLSATQLREIMGKQIENEHWQYCVDMAILKNIEINFEKDIESSAIPFKLISDFGIVFNSGEYTGLSSADATKKMVLWLEKNNLGQKITNYKLRDWLISRQRYWGCPIPIVYDPSGNAHAVDEKDLPLILPTDVDFKPTGESPMKRSESFKKLAEERYGKGWYFETDTLDTFVDSSWYYLRHTDANNTEEAFSKDKVNYWLPTDLYMIGAEHTVLHLLYSRFFTKFFYDQKLVNFDEPFYFMRHMGTILGPDGRKMSKRWGNVINPTDEANRFSSDTVRMYEMFIGPLEESKPWNDRAENGLFRFLNKVWDQQSKIIDNKSGEIDLEDKFQTQKFQFNKLIKKVDEDTQKLSFNTSIAKFMEFVNFLNTQDNIEKTVWKNFLLILAPYAPFITEELWSLLGSSESIHLQKFPEYIETVITNETLTIAVQINGKVRGTIEIGKEEDQNAAIILAKANDNIQKYLTAEPKKVIYIKGKILNIIV